MGSCSSLSFRSQLRQELRCPRKDLFHQTTSKCQASPRQATRRSLEICSWLRAQPPSFRSLIFLNKPSRCTYIELDKLRRQQLLQLAWDKKFPTGISCAGPVTAAKVMPKCF